MNRTSRSLRYSRLARSERLFAAYQRTGDRRKLKRAKRIRAREVRDSLREVVATFQRAAQTIAPAMRAAAEAAQRLSLAHQQIKA